VRRELFRIRAIGSLRRLEYYLDPSGGLMHLTSSMDAVMSSELSYDNRASRRRRQMPWMPMPSLLAKRPSLASLVIPSLLPRRTWFI
jgi:hypothetical protein